jgi:hypothetical protein
MGSIPVGVTIREFSVCVSANIGFTPCKKGFLFPGLKFLKFEHTRNKQTVHANILTIWNNVVKIKEALLRNDRALNAYVIIVSGLYMQNSRFQNKDRYLAWFFTLFTILYFVLFFKLETAPNSDSYHIMGFSVIPFAVLSIIFSHRSRTRNQSESVKKTVGNVLKFLILLPVYLSMSIYHSFLLSGVDDGSLFGIFSILIGWISIISGLVVLIAILINKNKLARIGLIIFFTTFMFNFILMILKYSVPY